MSGWGVDGLESVWVRSGKRVVGRYAAEGMKSSLWDGAWRMRKDSVGFDSVGFGFSWVWNSVRHFSSFFLRDASCKIDESLSVNYHRLVVNYL